MTKQGSTASNTAAGTAKPEIQKATLSGQVTAAQIEAWKKKHEDAWSYTAGGRICYLRKADRTVVGLATLKASSMEDGAVDPMMFAEVIITNCWLGGDNALRDEDKFFIGLAQQVNQIVEIETGILKKL